ncbi:MAG: hypothetical protein U0Z44_21515 [Kouleothrix sp.]
MALARQALASGRRAYAERILAALVARSAGAELPALLPALHQAALEALPAALARAAAAQPNHPQRCITPACSSNATARSTRPRPH